MCKQSTIDKLCSFGFGVYSIEQGKLDSNAKYAIADPCDGKYGIYTECNTLADVCIEAKRLLESIPFCD